MHCENITITRANSLIAVPHGKCSSVCENFSFVEVNYEYVMIVWLKGIYKVNTIASSMFFAGGTQVTILDTVYRERSPYWLLLLLESRYIALIQFCLKMIHWKVGRK